VFRAHKSIIRGIGVLALLVLAIVLAACGTTKPLVTSVTIDQGTTGTMLVGASLNLTATVNGTNGAATTVTWQSSDDAVATVDASGGVQAVALGAVTVTATSTEDAAKSDSIAITIDDLPLDASNVYVDASWTSGGNGSAAAPYRTVTAGVTYVDPAGTVHVAAGTYPEGLHLTKVLHLAGAGAGNTIITVSESVGTTGLGMAVDNVDGANLSGFTLRVDAPGPASGALGVYGGSANFTLQNVTISQHDTNDNAGLILNGVTTATVNNVTVDDVAGDSAGPGVMVTNSASGASTDVTLANVTVNGHSNYAGIVLAPVTTLAGINITGATLNQLDMLQLNLDDGGTVTNLTAPQFVMAVRNGAPAYASGGKLFYKMSELTAVTDSLYNFNAPTQSYIQELDGTDQAVLLDSFIVGSADGTAYGSPGFATNSIQAAIDAAAPGATINVRDGNSVSYHGTLTVDKALTITGAGGASQITAPAGSSVITVTGDPVVITGVDIGDNGSAAVAFDATAVPNLRINGSNLTSALAIDDSAASAITPKIDATGNWWGAAAGPVAGQVVSANDNVDTSSPLGAAVP